MVNELEELLSTEDFDQRVIAFLNRGNTLWTDFSIFVMNDPNLKKLIETLPKNGEIKGLTEGTFYSLRRTAHQILITEAEQEYTDLIEEVNDSRSNTNAELRLSSLEEDVRIIKKGIEYSLLKFSEKDEKVLVPTSYEAVLVPANYLDYLKGIIQEQEFSFTPPSLVHIVGRREREGWIKVPNEVVTISTKTEELSDYLKERGISLYQR